MAAILAAAILDNSTPPPNAVRRHRLPHLPWDLVSFTGSRRLPRAGGETREGRGKEGAGDWGGGGGERATQDEPPSHPSRSSQKLPSTTSIEIQLAAASNAH